MQNDISDLIEAIDKIADTSFVAIDTFGLIAKRPSGSPTTGFYRPGERSENGVPFEVLPTKCPKYCGPPSGRAPTEIEKRVAWPLQDEYLANRLGKDRIESCRLWDTARWVDKVHRIEAMPRNATQPPSLLIAPEDYDKKEIADFKVEREVPAVAFDVLAIIERMDERDELAKIDIDNLMRDVGPRPVRVDFPGLYERAEASKIIRMLRLGLRTLWRPVELAVVDHVEMYRLGMTQGARRDTAAGIGRQRVIEGLRIADSIRKGITRSEKQDVVAIRPLARADGEIEPVEGLIRDLLAALANRQLPANDNYRADAIANNAA